MQDVDETVEEEVDKELVPIEKQYVSPTQSRTLLPAPIASAVSLVTRSSSLYLQLGSFIGGLALDGARVTTLTGLEVSRAVIERILSQAGQDVANRSTGEYGRGEAEGILERSISALHQTVTAASFAASTGFYMSATVLGSVTGLSQQFLASLDGILGSTDSSRAISSIVTLIRREFQNPATGQEGEKVGVSDLLVGICGLALLQKWCEKIVALEIEQMECEEVVWDVVTLSNGTRVDVPHDSEANGVLKSTQDMQLVSEESRNEDDGIPEESTEMGMRKKITDSLPEDSSISIITQTKVDKTITIEIIGAHPSELELPEGVRIIEEKRFYLPGHENARQDKLIPAYRAVYSSTMEKTTGTSVISQALIGKGNTGIELLSLGEQHSPLQLPTSGPSHDPIIDQSSRDSKGGESFEISKRSSMPDSRENTANQKRTRQASSSILPRSETSQYASKEVSASRTTPKADRKASKPPEKKSALRQAFKIGSSTTLANLWSEQVPNSSQLPRSPVSLRGQPVQRLPASGRSPTKHDRSKSFVHSRPASPTEFRSQLAAYSQSVHGKSSTDSLLSSVQSAVIPCASRDYAPSIYTLKTHGSSTSLALVGRVSAFDNMEALNTLRRAGQIDGLFPRNHLVHNITRFVRFASASYGASFLRVMGIVTASTSSSKQIDTKHHHEHHSFSNHTQLPPDTILLSSFVDPAGGTDSSGQTGTGVPMVHFVSLDHDSKAVVLTCRGTLGFEDILTDMTCDYDILTYQGKDYSVHRGIHASARRLLNGASSKVVAIITAALEEFPDYGLVMCGHSLGGAVVSLLAIMMSEPSPESSSTAFVTSSNSSYPQTTLLQNGTRFDRPRPQANWSLPSGRPIHVYAYGPPATLSAGLRQATRGLITTIVNGQDLVPYLSLGVLHDMQAISLAFKNDTSGAKGEVRARVWEGLKGNFSDRWYNQPGPETTRMAEDDKWAYSALKALRASMLSSKLVPPGEVFRVETSPVLRREAFVKGERDEGIGRPATRSVLRYVRNVEKKFGEISFGGSMLADHSPGRYEASLNALHRGVMR